MSNLGRGGLEQESNGNRSAMMVAMREGKGETSGGPRGGRVWPALLCALMPAVCYVLVRPYAEIGIDDDWSYVKTAQVLVATGHLVYNGWATAMLGWQLYLGALLVKVFGFSFTVVRLSSLLEAMATGWLLQQTMVRAGLTERNATLATLTVIVSPLFLPLATTFMTDISGLLAIVLCLYQCVRALQASSEAHAAAWIVAAALTNAVGGTARQIAWLGVLVMVPSAVWLLRRSKRVLVAGALSCAVGWVLVYGAMQWFARQPYALPEPLVPRGLSMHSALRAIWTALQAVAELALWSAPILLVFSGRVRWRDRHARRYLLAGIVFAVLWFVAGAWIGRPGETLAPFMFGDTAVPVLRSLAAKAWAGEGGNWGLFAARCLLTAVALSGLLCAWVAVLTRRTTEHEPAAGRGVSWRELGVLLGPFATAYVLLLMPRMAVGDAYDRYLLPLLALLLLVAARLLQEKVRRELPWWSAALIAGFGIFSVMATHDMFALYRGYVAAMQEVRATGVPETAVLGPWEAQGWTQVEKGGYVNDPRIRVPANAYVKPEPRVSTPNCGWGVVGFLPWTPVLKPRYALTLDAGVCEGESEFAPVEYRTWLPPRAKRVYLVRLPAELSR